MLREMFRKESKRSAKSKIVKRNKLISKSPSRLEFDKISFSEVTTLNTLYGKNNSLDWLKQEKALIALNYTRSLEVWLVKARNAMLQGNIDSENPICDFEFESLLADTEKEIQFYTELTAKLYTQVPSSDPGHSRDRQAESSDIIEVRTEKEESAIASSLPEKKAPNSSKVAGRGRRCTYSIGKMFSRIRRSFSTQRVQETSRVIRSARESQEHYNSTTSTVDSGVFASRSGSQSESCIKHLELCIQQETPTEEKRCSWLDLGFESPISLRSPIRFSFSEIWPHPLEDKKENQRLYYQNDHQMPGTQETLSQYYPHVGKGTVLYV